MKRVLVIMRHKIVKKVLSYTVCIVVGALGISYMQSIAKQGMYAEFSVQQVDMNCYPVKQDKGDEV